MVRSPVRLQTSRLILDLPDPDEAAEVLDYYRRNAAHLEPWEPRRPRGFDTVGFHRLQLAGSRQDYRDDRALRLYLRLREAPARIVGSCGLTSFQRGAFEACTLGYGMDHALQGRGLMREAVARVVDFAFYDLGFHRVMAAYVPENVKSGALLRALGFVIEGYARSYIEIDGRWRDHVLTSKVRP